MEHREIILQLKRRMLEVAYKNQIGFLPSSFSILDILVCLYYDIMSDEDQFVLSKGHSVFGLYAVLESKLIITPEKFENIGKFGSNMSMAAERWGENILFTTGSLGHGFPEGVGLACGNKIQRKNNRVFVLIGDGELNEGSNWEAVMAAEKLKLDNLVCIIDNNKTTNRAINYRNLYNKFKSFYWDVIEIDGHDATIINSSLQSQHKRPLAVIANTIKGKGSKTMESDAELWHAKAPNWDEYNILLEELNIK